MQAWAQDCALQVIIIFIIDHTLPMFFFSFDTKIQLPNLFRHFYFIDFERYGCNVTYINQVAINSRHHLRNV